jgi:hypothetical protein
MSDTDSLEDLKDIVIDKGKELGDELVKVGLSRKVYELTEELIKFRSERKDILKYEEEREKRVREKQKGYCKKYYEKKKELKTEDENREAGSIALKNQCNHLDMRYRPPKRCEMECHGTLKTCRSHYHTPKKLFFQLTDIPIEKRCLEADDGDIRCPDEQIHNLIPYCRVHLQKHKNFQDNVDIMKV